MAEKYTGGCYCGALRYEVTGAARQIVACHCIDCQRQTGSAFGMTMVVAEEDFRITQGKEKTIAIDSEAGREKIAGFCPDCGSRIYAATSWRPGMIAVKPGTLDDTGALKPQVHLWTSRKQGWIVIPEGVEAYETQPS